jgi:hypothetical protein
MAESPKIRCRVGGLASFTSALGVFPAANSLLEHILGGSGL